MNVRRLIELLRAEDPDAEVGVSGDVEFDGHLDIYDTAGWHEVDMDDAPVVLPIGVKQIEQTEEK